MNISSEALEPVPKSEPNQKDRDVITEAAVELSKAGDDPNTLNPVIKRRLMIIDQAYQNYVTGLRQEKTRSDFITGISAIAIGVAGTLTESAGVKTNYAAAGTLLAGGSVLASKTLYYEQTVLALVAAMDASRADVRLKILTSMEDDTSVYTATEAYKDLLEYERAGTLLSAIGYVQATAKKSLASTEEHIQVIARLTPDQRKYRTCVSRSLFKDNAKRNTTRLVAVAAALKVDIPATEMSDDEAISSKLRDVNRNSTPAQIEHMYGVLKDNGMMVPCGT